MGQEPHSWWRGPPPVWAKDHSFRRRLAVGQQGEPNRSSLCTPIFSVILTALAIQPPGSHIWKAVPPNHGALASRCGWLAEGGLQDISCSAAAAVPSQRRASSLSCILWPAVHAQGPPHTTAELQRRPALLWLGRAEAEADKVRVGTSREHIHAHEPWCSRCRRST